MPYDPRVHDAPHHPRCDRDPYYFERRPADPRLPGAEVRSCEHCKARLVTLNGEVIDDPDREELELWWQAEELRHRLRTAEESRRRDESLTAARAEIGDLHQALSGGDGSPTDAPLTQAQIVAAYLKDINAPRRTTGRVRGSQRSVAGALHVHESTLRRRLQALELTWPPV